MASTALVKDVLWRATVLLQDSSPQFVHWEERELVAHLNDAQAAITKYLPSACSRLDSVRLQVGTRQSIDTIIAADCKPGDGSTPAAPIQGVMLLDVVRNMGVSGTAPGRAIRLVEREALDEGAPDWHTETGVRVSGYTYDPRGLKYFYVTPGLSARAWVELLYAAMPVKVPAGGAPGAEVYLFSGGSTATISIGDENVDDLVNYVVARANMKDSEWAESAKAAQFSGLFLASLNARVTALTGNNPGLTLLPFAMEPLARAKA